MLELFKGALPTHRIYAKWEDYARERNAGALCIFTGIVRAEHNISALSFDIYEPLLQKWFDTWQERANKDNVELYMAHSIGDVLCGQSSYMCGILSPNRRGALGLYEEFIEDFKANAPIWKYDVINNHRIYAKERSKALSGSGILGNGAK
ncbi:molybdenum cofactor biosynthesis protein MoaE [Helicobacter jaachi]|uniref:Molybdopterin synthase catalytic subunit n=1 Tax=Helicobacter jaachi TaxID=1677920 RepID=A0A4U8TC44_9HELI|nr:molybdenum cofactor biosynthesis protein MoaE [Helicobacter jaachi]TLD96207.1 molybdenum cofactor biosynthesis protein MoaE [Helicobacter jaachi]